MGYYFTNWETRIVHAKDKDNNTNKTNYYYYLDDAGDYSGLEKNISHDSSDLNIVCTLHECK